MSQAVTATNRQSVSRHTRASSHSRDQHATTRSTNTEFTTLDDYFFSAKNGAVINRNSNPDVIRAVQTELKAIFGDSAPLTDGIYDTKMQNLVKRFQQLGQKQGLRVTGNIDDLTYAYIKRYRHNPPDEKSMGKIPSKDDATKKIDELDEVRQGKKIIGPRSDPYLVNKLRDILMEKHSDVIKVAGEKFGFTEIPKGRWGTEISFVVGEIQRRAGFTDKGIPGRPGTKWDSLVGRVTLGLIEGGGAPQAEKPAEQLTPSQLSTGQAQEDQRIKSLAQSPTTLTPTQSAAGGEKTLDFEIDLKKASQVFALIGEGKTDISFRSNRQNPEQGYPDAIGFIQKKLATMMWTDENGQTRPYLDVNHPQFTPKRYTFADYDAIRQFQANYKLGIKIDDNKFEPGLDGRVERKTLEAIMSADKSKHVSHGVTVPAGYQEISSKIEPSGNRPFATTSNVNEGSGS